MSLKAYHQTQRATEDPRDAEYRLFGLVTRALMDASSEAKASPKLMQAIDWNRRLWSALASDCADDNNQLPATLRAQIISLGMWVSRYSSQVARGHAAIDPLIDINRTIMQGLASRPADTASAAG
jgi:flagellar biosynthesis activator protein FlaF